MKLVTPQQMSSIEQACQQSGITNRQLMEQAGMAIAGWIMQNCRLEANNCVVMLIGPGNNGGDGLVAARCLSDKGCRIDMIMPVISETNRDLLQEAVAAGAELVDMDAGPDSKAEQAAVIVDAFFGTGKNRPVQGAYRAVLEKVGLLKQQRYHPLCVAIDIPSGVDGNSGACDQVVFRADYTLALGYAKTGLYNSMAAVGHCGQILVLDIGIPDKLAEKIPGQILEEGWAAGIIPNRPVDAHKGTFGRVMVVAGSEQYPGAAFLAAAGAARAGAGLVTLSLPANIQSVVAGHITEATFLPWPGAGSGVEAAGIILNRLNHYTGLLIGCGIGQSTRSVELVTNLLLGGSSLPPAVIDADGLNLLSVGNGWWRQLAPGNVLTPHPGEMERLSGLKVSDIQENRIDVARQYAAQWKQVVVLKGAYTVIADPDEQFAVNPVANPLLASAGTGDVLAGIIAGLMVQGVPPFEAACLGVYLHSQAGVRLSADMGKAGGLASELLAFIPGIIKNLSEMR